MYKSIYCSSWRIQYDWAHFTPSLSSLPKTYGTGLMQQVLISGGKLVIVTKFRKELWRRRVSSWPSWTST